MAFSFCNGSDNSSILRFTAPPDYEAPADRNSDNSYEVTVQVSDESLYTAFVGSDFAEEGRMAERDEAGHDPEDGADALGEGHGADTELLQAVGLGASLRRPARHRSRGRRRLTSCRWW